MSQFIPELGQMCFGQPFKEFSVPSYVEATLVFLREEIERFFHNKFGSKLGPSINPFDNSGFRAGSPVFSIHAYSWNEEENQQWNFRYHKIGFEVSWYKYLGRGMSCNFEISSEECSKMLDDCLSYIRTQEKKLFEERKDGDS